MSTMIHERVQLARQGNNPYVIARLRSGWVVIGDVQPLPGYCLLLADPVVSSINDLDEAARAAYSLDVVRVGDALLASTECYRVNYETWGNTEQALHTHIMPRYLTEPDDKRPYPTMIGYSWKTARKFDPVADGPFVKRMAEFLKRFSV